MRKYLLLSLFLISNACYAFACLNEYHVRRDGEPTDLGSPIPVFYRSFDQEYAKSQLKAIDLNQLGNYTYEQISDAAVSLSKLGRYKESLALLQPLVVEHPEEYTLAANLGTLYELNGNLDSAYQYIKKGMELNPESHHGSEWVHLAILRSKQKMKTNPDWIYHHSVIDLDLEQPFEIYSERANSTSQKINQMAYQMQERVPFSKDDDPLLANIFLKMGQLSEIHTSIERAYIFYRIADFYDKKQRMGIKHQLSALLPLLALHEIEIPQYTDHFPPREQFYKEGTQKRLRAIASQKSPLVPPALRWVGAGVLTVLLILLCLKFGRKLLQGRPNT